MHRKQLVFCDDRRSETECLGVVGCQLSQERITERNRFYLTDLHFLREIFELGRFLPYWIHGAMKDPRPSQGVE